MRSEVCVICGMSKNEWTGGEGRGVARDGQHYCCEGCAEETGCICAEIKRKTERVLRGRDSGPGHREF